MLNDKDLGNRTTSNYDTGYILAHTHMLYGGEPQDIDDIKVHLKDDDVSLQTALLSNGEFTFRLVGNAVDIREQETYTLFRDYSVTNYEEVIDNIYLIKDKGSAYPTYEMYSVVHVDY